MARRIIKRVLGFGTHSIGMVLPKDWSRKMGVLDSGLLAMEYDEVTKTITLTNAQKSLK